MRKGCKIFLQGVKKYMGEIGVQGSIFIHESAGWRTNYATNPPAGGRMVAELYLLKYVVKFYEKVRGHTCLTARAGITQTNAMQMNTHKYFQKGFAFRLSDYRWSPESRISQPYIESKTLLFIN